MACMGRRRSINSDLPPRMARKRKAFYYVTTSTPRLWIALGSDKAKALAKWAELEGAPAAATEITFAIAWNEYQRVVIPTKAPATQKDNLREGAMLMKVFGSMAIDDIEPTHVRQYLTARGETAATRANREKALLSHIFNMARQWGFTRASNPCSGVKGFVTPGRDRYIEDEEYKRLWACADEPLRDAMDLALLTGQRPSDVLRFKRGDIREGALWLRQGKTGKRMRITIEGEFAAVLARCTARAASMSVSCLNIVQNENGQPLTLRALEWRWKKAREAAGVQCQFRDLRAKAGTDSPSLENAKRLLGHKGIKMTEHYVRHRIGERVKPLR